MSSARKTETWKNHTSALEKAKSALGKDPKNTENVLNFLGVLAQAGKYVAKKERGKSRNGKAWQSRERTLFLKRLILDTLKEQGKNISEATQEKFIHDERVIYNSKEILPESKIILNELRSLTTSTLAPEKMRSNLIIYNYFSPEKRETELSSEEEIQEDKESIESDHKDKSKKASYSDSLFEKGHMEYLAETGKNNKKDNKATANKIK